jgi:hypothetical protein
MTAYIRESGGNPNAGAKRHKRLFAVPLLYAASLLPGLVLSAALFSDAYLFDSANLSRILSSPNTDLSEVRIEGFALGELPEGYDRKTDYSNIYTENGEYYYRQEKDYSVMITASGTDQEGESIHYYPPLVYEGGSPISSISIEFPIVSTSRQDGRGADASRLLFIGDQNPQTIDDMIAALGNTFVSPEYGYRGRTDCRIYIDRKNNIQLSITVYARENAYDEIVGNVELSRPDNHTLRYYFDEASALSRGNAGFWNPSHGYVFDDLYPPEILKRVFSAFETHSFLNPDEYAVMLFYWSAWLFPLALSLCFRKIWLFATSVIWYLLYFFFCGITLLGRL